MKSNNLALFTVLALLSLSVCFNACSDPETHSCDDEALFSREEATGMMVYLPCFDSWAVRLDETNVDGHLFAVSRDIRESLHLDSTVVKIDACFYEFDMEPLLPDPALWGDMYLIKDFDISTDL